MRDERAGIGAGRLLLTEAAHLVEGWLSELEESGDGLLGACDRVLLGQALMQSIEGQPRAAGASVITLPDGALQQAARSLRKHLELRRDGTTDRRTRRHMLLACKRMAAGREGAPSGDNGSASLPASVLAEATNRIRRAGAAVTVKRIAVAAAARVCEAETAIWWDQHDSPVPIIAAVHGRKPKEGPVGVRFGPSFWKSGPSEGVAVLDPQVAGHRELLAYAGASRGVVVRARLHTRPAGALGVFSGKFDHERLNLLVALTQNAALASEALASSAEQQRRPQRRRRSASDIGLVLGSALSLDELLDLICRTSAELVGAEGSLIYLGTNGELGLRSASHPELRASAGARLSEFAQRTRTQPPGRPLRRTVARGIDGLGYRSLLGTVLSVRGDPMGALILLSDRPEAFDPGERESIASFAAHAGVAIENRQLVEDMQRRMLELADLSWVSSRIGATMQIERIAATVVEAAAKALEASRAALFVVNQEGTYAPVAHGQYGLGGEEKQDLPESGHLAHEVLTLGAPRIISDVLREGKADDALVQWLGVRSLIAVPLTAQHGLKGVLAVGDEEAREYPPHAVVLLSAYANHSALALQSAILYQDVLRHLKLLESLFEVSQTLTSSLELTQTLDGVLNAASALLDAPVATLMLVEGDGDELTIKAAKGLQPDDEFHRPLKLGDGLAGRAAQSGAPLVSAEISRDGRFSHRGQAREGGLRAAIAAPLIARGRRIGVLSLYRRSCRAFSEDDIRIAMALANTAAIAIENARLYQETQERAQFLTAMMSEVNHRVRNTLQAVTGLLRMEMDRRPPRSIRDVLGRAMARLQSVAVVHDMLSVPDLRFVDMKQVARRIVQLICQTGAPGAGIEARVSGARVMLPSQQATNVAMVLSELVDNAVRHGRPAVSRILVSLAEGGGNVVIEVKDDGAGLSAEFEQETDSGLGLKVVRAIIEEELDGSLDIESNNGLTVRAKFPKHR